MTFAHIPSGETVFLDANTFVYSYIPHPTFGTPCHQLLDRADRGDVFGYTSTAMLSEMSHRLMTLESQDLFQWPAASIGKKLRKNPQLLSARLVL